MKRQTREELAAECVRLREENNVLSHAVNFLLRRARPNAVETVREKDGGRYDYQAFDVCAPHGGILLVTFYYPNQRPSTTAHYLESYFRDARYVSGGLRHVHAEQIGRLQQKTRALQREISARV
jgi:hypothetical protein